MTVARSEILKTHETAAYHCIARCVRRAWLCGFDKYANKSYEHRKEWVKERLKTLANIFYIKVLTYCVMDNHLHVVLSTSPEEAQKASAEEILQRWNMLYPQNYDKLGNPQPLTTEQIDKLLLDEKKLAEKRERLSNISWYMKSLNEYLARRANAEEEKTGRFWEGRFKCQLLADEAAILTCMTYVDLNPVRADVCKRPEDSDFTGVKDRITALKAKENIKNLKEEEKKQHTDPGLNNQNLSDAKEADWLLPLDKEPHGNLGLSLDISVKDYIDLVDYTGRFFNKDKRGAIPADLDPILKRLKIDDGKWFNTIESYNRFRRVLGKVDAIKELAKQAGKRWFQGLGANLEAFGAT